MELLIFYLKGYLFGIQTDFVESVEKIITIKEQADIQIKKNEVIKKNIKYNLLNLYELFYNEKREIIKLNDYIIFLNNKSSFNTENLKHIAKVDTIKYNFSLMEDKKYLDLFVGTFIIENKIGLILNGNKMNDLLQNRSNIL